MLRGFICPFDPFKGPTAVPECDFILSFIPLVPTLFPHYFTETTGGIRIWTLSPLTLKKEETFLALFLCCALSVVTLGRNCSPLSLRAAAQNEKV